MLCGEYVHNIDSKNRIMLPAKLREKLGSNVVVTKSVDKCLSVYPEERWEEITAKLSSLPEIETRNIKRFMYSSAYETAVDTFGRLLITPTLCEYASLSKTVKIVGVGDRIEIWDEKLWDCQMSMNNASEMTNLLIKLGF